MFKLSIILHVLAATIWAGGHLALVFMYLLPAIKGKNLSDLLDFEKRYEIVGMPSLVILIVTGLFQSYTLIPDLSAWFDFSNYYSAHFSAKIIMVLMIASLALDMKLRVMKQKVLSVFSFSWHILIVTVLSVLLVITGLSFRLNIF